MPGSPVRLGPFTGGLNNESDPSSIGDNELYDCVNLEFKSDGSLVSRPPFTALATAPGTSNLKALGYGRFSGAYYLIFSGGGKTYYFSSGSFTEITASFAASSVVQYDDFIWLTNSAGAGGKWSPGGGFVSVSAMPAGSASVIHKERMYLVPGTGSRVRFSALADLTTWDSANFFDLGSGDGEDVLDIVMYNDNVFMFKQDSTYVLSYDSAPKEGTVRRISDEIGVSGPNCTVIYNNVLYLYHEGDVFEVINTDFSRINLKIKFEKDITATSTYVQPVFMSRYHNRLVVRYYSWLYVYGLETRTWTKWRSNQFFGPLCPIPSDDPLVIPRVIAGSALSANTTIYQSTDDFSSDFTETIDHIIETKNIDLGSAHQFKRLFWWGFDGAFKGTLVGSVQPVVRSFSVTWDQIAAYTWDQLNTWDYPLTESPRVDTTITSIDPVRAFNKFLKGLRARQLGFSLKITTDGTTPCRIFSLTAIIDTKEKVVKAVT